MFLSVPSTRKLKKSQLMGQLGNQKFVKIDQKEPESLFASLWKFFAKNTSVHGVHYLAEPSTNIFEKLLWSVGIISATAAMIHSCTMLSGRFSASLLSTVFESTSFKVSEIPFAAVTLCNNNRLDYNKTNAAIATLFPNRSQSETETFVKFVHALQNMEWGSFDELIVVSEDDTTEMDKLNISQVYEFMMHDCEAFFVSCSWRKVPFNCCDHFSKQLSEYGICWSFNSYSNAGTEHVNRSSNFPLRIRGSGLRSALKVVINTHPETSIDRSEFANSNPGVMAIVHHPSEWPTSSYFVAAGSVTALKIKPTAFSTSDDVKELDPQQRQCIYNDEAEKINVTYRKGLPYMKPNCLSACRQKYSNKFCNCSVGFLHPSNGFPQCNFSGLLCLIPYNDMFNAEKPLRKNQFFDENEEGLQCSCLPECSRIDYRFEISPIYDEKKIEDNLVLIDVHYESPTMMKYRTDVTFSDMDLLIGFGGIVSLFLGCSLISGVEIIYFTTIALFWQRKRIRKEIVSQIKSRLPFVH